MSGQLPQGVRLVEERLARSMGISRAPVREALGLLRAEGLVSEDAHGGSFVTSLDLDDIREIYEARAAIEAGAAKRVAASGSNSDIALLERAASRINEAVEAKDYREAAWADVAFHEMLCRVSRNGRLHSAFLGLSRPLAALLTADEYYYGNVARQVGDHEYLVSALKGGDPERAARCFEDHSEQAKDALLRYLGELPRSRGSGPEPRE
jgi:DNA-binding GntR family transcriptional regulator